MRIGLAGFPGSGKTTVFNALTGLSAQTGPGGHSGTNNLGVVKVPDPRLDALADLYHPRKRTPTEITFADIAGGGSARGLDRRALNAMREVDALCQVVAAFDDPLREAPLSPSREVGDLIAELVLADLELVEGRLTRLHKEGARTPEMTLLERVGDCLQAERPLRALELTDIEHRSLRGYHFLSIKPLLLVVNVNEGLRVGTATGDPTKDIAEQHGLGSIVMSARIEMEIAQLENEEQREFCEALGLEEPARDRFIRDAFSLLDLVSMFTLGNDDCHAWPLRRGTTAPRAAGKVHSDMERGFIRVEVIPWDVLLKHGSEARCREVGLLRIEGRSYVIQDGDVVHFRFNV